MKTESSYHDWIVLQEPAGSLLSLTARHHQSLQKHPPSSAHWQAEGLGRGARSQGDTDLITKKAGPFPVFGRWDRNRGETLTDTFLRSCFYHLPKLQKRESHFTLSILCSRPQAMGGRPTNLSGGRQIPLFAFSTGLHLESGRIVGLSVGRLLPSQVKERRGHEGLVLISALPARSIRPVWRPGAHLEALRSTARFSLRPPAAELCTQ